MAGETDIRETAITTEQAEQMGEALERGYTLTAEWYTDPAIYALEQRRVFRKSWQYVDMTDQLARPGDFVTATIGEVPIVITRGEDGELRAFANVCRHRGAQVVREACGNRKTLQCHYHAWTYNLDGSLRAAPGMKDEPGFDTSAYPLRPAAPGDLGTVHLRQPRRRGKAAEPLSRRVARAGGRDGAAA